MDKRSRQKVRLFRNTGQYRGKLLAAQQPASKILHRAARNYESYPVSLDVQVGQTRRELFAAALLIDAIFHAFSLSRFFPRPLCQFSRSGRDTR